MVEEKSELDRVLDQISDLQLLRVCFEEIRLNPVDYDRLRIELEKKYLTPVPVLTHLCGVKVVKDETVQPTRMRVWYYYGTCFHIRTIYVWYCI